MNPVARAVIWVLLLSGCAATPHRTAETGEAELALLIGDRTPGAPVHCINMRHVRSSRIVARTAIVYQISRSLFYVNQPLSGAEALATDAVLLSRTPTGTLCDGTIVHLLDSDLNQQGAVALSTFVPYRATAPAPVSKPGS